MSINDSDSITLKSSGTGRTEVASEEEAEFLRALSDRRRDREERERQYSSLERFCRACRNPDVELL